MAICNRVIICPKTSVNKNDIIYFAQKVNGRIVEAIGTDSMIEPVNNTDYYIVYQYPPGGIREEFKTFCENNVELVRRADLLIMAPLYSMSGNISNYDQEYELLNNYYSGLKGETQTVKVLITTKLNRERQYNICRTLGYRSECLSNDLRMGYTKMMFFEMPLSKNEVSLEKEMIALFIGVVAILIGVAYTVIIFALFPVDGKTYYGGSGNIYALGSYAIMFGVLDLIFLFIRHRYAKWVRRN